MSRKKTQHTKQFKLDAVNYRKEHPDLTQVECVKNLGIGVNILARWETHFRDNDGDISVRESGNYESDEAKEIARLKRELRNAQYALNVLKSYRHSGERLTEAIYTEVSANVEAAKVTKRRVSTSGMLKFLGVSRSGYRAFLNRKVSPARQQKKLSKRKARKYMII